MTKNGRNPKNRREASRYPALDKGLNLKSRKDYIESDYVDGVRDEEGNLLIRPLNDEEKRWLNNFYEETINTNFNPTSEMKRLNRAKKAIVEDNTVLDLKAQIKKLQEEPRKNGKRIKELRQIVSFTKKQNEETYAEKLVEIETSLQELRDEFLLYPDKEEHKQFYNANNSRNNCILNKSKSMNKLKSLEPKDYESYLAKKTKDLDFEDVIINEIEGEKSEEIKEKLDLVMKEVEDYFKKQKKS